VRQTSQAKEWEIDKRRANYNCHPERSDRTFSSAPGFGEPGRGVEGSLFDWSGAGFTRNWKLETENSRNILGGCGVKKVWRFAARRFPDRLKQADQRCLPVLTQNET
jgi:hypothetical protein